MISVAVAEYLFADYAAGFVDNHNDAIADNDAIAGIDLMLQGVQQVLELRLVELCCRTDAISAHRFHGLIDCPGASAKDDCEYCKE